EEAPPTPGTGLAQPGLDADPRPRLWPGVVIVVLQWLIIMVPAWIAPVTMTHFLGWFLGPIIGAAGLAIWWLFASRLPWRDRWLGLLAFGVTGITAWLCCHPSIGVFGLVLYALPTATTAW